MIGLFNEGFSVEIIILASVRFVTLWGHCNGVSTPGDILAQMNKYNWMGLERKDRFTGTQTSGYLTLYLTGIIVTVVYTASYSDLECHCNSSLIMSIIYFFQ